MLISIRNKLFETNSSSTHSLVLENNINISEEDINMLKNLKLNIKILDYTPTPDSDFDIYSSIEEKLTYLYAVMLQSGINLEKDNQDFSFRDDSVNNLFKLIHEICPNITFEKPNEQSYYILEDCEWVFDEQDFKKLLIKENLTKFLLHGVIYNLSRDYNIQDYILDSKVQKLKEKVKKAYIGISFSG